MWFLTVLCAVVLASPAMLVSPVIAGGGDAQDVAMEMIDAHGGMRAWKQAATMSFKNSFVAPYDPDDPWVSIETTQQGSRRSYQDWPLDNATVAYDGEQVWSVGWKRDNPPKFMVNMAYYFLNLPWLTQDDGVVLAGPGKGKLPNDDAIYTTIRMTFEAGVGDAPDDYYEIFIDPDTHLMRGVEYIVTYGAMLDLIGVPADVRFFGPLVKVFESYATVAGLKVPAKFNTYSMEGDVYGEHIVEDISFSKKFDEARMSMPDGAVIDSSSNKRQAPGS
jgi:hypothetical protein